MRVATTSGCVFKMPWTIPRQHSATAKSGSRSRWITDESSLSRPLLPLPSASLGMPSSRPPRRVGRRRICNAESRDKFGADSAMLGSCTVAGAAAPLEGLTRLFTGRIECCSCVCCLAAHFSRGKLRTTKQTKATESPKLGSVDERERGAETQRIPRTCEKRSCATAVEGCGTRDVEFPDESERRKSALSRGALEGKAGTA
eukprot:scaffold7055_cov254-Pinguiococcus_pyrenoidosus.AAC.7